MAEGSWSCDMHLITLHWPVTTFFCRLLITFASSLDPDQARQNVGPDLDPNCLILRWYSLKDFFKKLILKKSADDKNAFKITQHANSHMTSIII